MALVVWMTHARATAKLVFLDMDGVLNTRESMRRARVENIYPPENPFFYTVDVGCVHRLRDVVVTAGAKLVITSSWRHSGLHPVIHALEWAGWHRPPIIGHTSFDELLRGHQIEAWLKGFDEKVEKYAILDDDADMLPAQEPFFIHVKYGLSAGGFLNEHAERLKELLR